MSTLGIKFAPVFDGLTGISHGFFTKHGGVSKGIYESLNTGQGSDDIPAHVEENRRRVASTIGTSGARLISCYQCHSTDVIITDKPWDMDTRPKADAIVTKTPGLAISALAADCAPVLFYDPSAQIIGAAHAGWRGALAGVTDKTIEAMLSIGAKRGRIIAAVGPCISMNNYEVGPDFVAEFISNNLGNAKFFRRGASDRSYFNLKAYLVRKLQRAKIGEAIALPDCTYGQNHDFFSYRYNTHQKISGYGRNISVIMLNQ